jgi:hypothetical protein
MEAEEGGQGIGYNDHGSLAVVNAFRKRES